MPRAKMPASINGVEFDVLIGQSESYQADAPEYPTEEGYSVSDSIILKATPLDITVFISNTPVTWQQRFGKTRNAAAVVEELKRLYFARELVTFRTTDGSWPNMAIVSMNISKSAETGYAYEIPIQLKQVRVTSAKTVTVTISFPRGGATGTNAGTASTSATASGKNSGSKKESKEEGKKTSSILYGLADTVGLFK